MRIYIYIFFFITKNSFFGISFIFHKPNPPPRACDVPGNTPSPPPSGATGCSQTSSESPLKGCLYLLCKWGPGNYFISYMSCRAYLQQPTRQSVLLPFITRTDSIMKSADI